MKGLDRRAFILGSAVAGIAATVPALTVVSELRHGPVDMKLVWLFGVTTLKTTLIAYPKKDVLALDIDVDRKVSILMVRSEVARIVNHRGYGDIAATRVEETARRHIASLRMRLQVKGKILRLMDAEEAEREKSPSVAMLRLEDIQAVLG